ncbi:MAG: hypothetical protein KH415_09660 [Clostridium sp.]|nr:hypothetical protein [Clostridium sp.]
MLDLIKIRDEINKLLVKKYPSLTVYINKVPKDFERPSFLIEYITSSQDQVNKNTLKEQLFYTITYFSTVDEYYNTDKLELHSVLVEVLKVFRVGYINIEDRAITIKASSGGSNENEIYIDLQLEYFENRIEEIEGIEEVGEIENNINLRRE